MSKALDTRPLLPTVRAGSSRALARGWLWMGVLALIGSGVLAIVLVLSRTPGIAQVFPLKDLFRAALVVHVDLSVLIWFMAFASLVWSLVTVDRWVAVGKLSIALAGLGTLLLAMSPFMPGAQPLLNNYVPVLQHPVFLAGLAMCGVGFGLTILRTLVWAWPGHAGVAATASRLHLGIYASALAGALAWAALLWSMATMPAIDGTAYYEILFWGGGHVLQFQHALLAAVAWWWLAKVLGAGWPVAERQATRWFAVAAWPLAAVPVMYLLWPASAPEHTTAFAKLMEWGHLLMVPVLAATVAALPGAWRAPSSPVRSALITSVLLFVTGGILAFMIRGVNVVVPAHYHGSIVGITLAMMGLAYVLLPQLGFGRATGRMARWQPWVYGGGQLMHILGLAWSGGYGVQRKVAGSAQVLVTVQERIGMGMMGLGGLIAVIGGVMFVWVCLVAMRSPAAPESGTIAR